MFFERSTNTMSPQNEMKYWLHRISHESDASYTLLFDKGYLSLGWSGFRNTDILNAARKDDDYKSFKQICSEKEETTPARWNMWYFARFNVGDFIVVPLYNGEFVICKATDIATSVISIKDAVPEFNDKQGNIIIWNDKKMIYCKEDGEQEIGIGFVIKVDIISGKDPRKRNEYADAKLTSRMKMRQTNGDITDIKDSVDEAIKSIEENKPLNFYEDALDCAAEAIQKRIAKLTPDKFENLVKSYMEVIGADYVEKPAKNETGKDDYSDADIIAQFNNLKIMIIIQVKRHEGESDEWAVEQIFKYKEQLLDDTSPLDHNNDGYDYIIPWAVTSCDFSKKAMNDAIEKQVRLINGKEFSRMLVDVGLSKIDVD